MRNVYLSFLGLGSRKEDGEFRYDVARYSLDGKPSDPTEFVQVAEIQLLGPKTFDEVIVVATERSYEQQYPSLESQLKELGVARITRVIIQEVMSSEGQWQWFEEILQHVRQGDRLTVDLTHGYRAIPIVFSAAVNFLQKARGVQLEGVYYGAYEKNRDLSPIVDMKDFFVIDEWAEAISRLVEDADARMVARMGREAPAFQTRTLSSGELIASFEQLTDAIRNVDIQNVGHAASKALDCIYEALQDASPMERVLLDTIVQKFSNLATPRETQPERYDRSYFQNQLEIVRLLLEHKLYMQAFTAMREMIASIGLIRNERARIHSADGRKQRRKGDVFLNMLQVDEAKWNFRGDDPPIVETLKPFYDELKSQGIVSQVRGILPDLLKYRNGFDHAWTAHNGASPDMAENGLKFLESLKRVVERLEGSMVLS